MGFLLRCGFWFSLVLLALPFDGGDDSPKAGAIQTLLAARAALSDVSDLCERKPDVCDTGRLAMHTVGVRAKEAARIAYEVLDKHVGKEEKAPRGTKAPPAAVADGADTTEPDQTAVTGAIAEIIRASQARK